MSASLVGSEMCIRDSLGLHSSSVHFPIAPSAPSAPSALGAPNGGSAQACLLYTSDAADDM
eukprot:5529010-Alexandrium_andersonii.AAC.1